MSDHPVEQEPTELELFQQKCREVAWNYAIKYGWCDEVQELLRELGLAVRDPRIQAAVTVTYVISGFVPWDYVTDEADKREWLESQLHIPSLATKGWIYEGKRPSDPVEMLHDPVRWRVRSVDVIGPKPETPND